MKGYQFFSVRSLVELKEADCCENKLVSLSGIVIGAVEVSNDKLKIPNVEGIKERLELGNGRVCYGLIYNKADPDTFIPIYAAGFPRGGLLSIFRASAEINMSVFIKGRYTGAKGNCSCEPVVIDELIFKNISRRYNQ